MSLGASSVTGRAIPVRSNRRYGRSLPAEHMLGAPGQGLKIALSALDSGRIGVAAQSVGVAQAALDASLAYARERRTFGKPIVEHQAIAFRLAEMATQDRGRSPDVPPCRVAEGPRNPQHQEASMAKLFASEMAQTVTAGRHPGSRRVRIPKRLSGREILSRCPGVHDLRRDQRSAEDVDRTRAPERGLTVPLRRTGSGRLR